MATHNTRKKLVEMRNVPLADDDVNFYMICNIHKIWVTGKSSFAGPHNQPLFICVWKVKQIYYWRLPLPALVFQASWRTLGFTPCRPYCHLSIRLVENVQKTNKKDGLKIHLKLRPPHVCIHKAGPPPDRNPALWASPPSPSPYRFSSAPSLYITPYLP